MFVRIALAIFVISALAAPPALAQARADVGVWAGFVLSDGVTGNAFLAGDGNIYDEVDPKDGGSWGFNAGFLIGEGAEVGFMFGNQFSTLQIKGTREAEIGDLSIKNYHGYFAYNWGASDAPIRPFAFGGLGATSFGSVDFQTLNRTGTIQGESQFSTTWGAGVKFLSNGRFGGRFHVRITPTYIKTDSVGWWCDPYWGCYLVGDAQYSNQFEFAGGFVARF